MTISADLPSLRLEYEDVDLNDNWLGGTSVDQRLELISAYWHVSLPRPNYVVWLLYARTALRVEHESLGPIHLYRADWLSETIANLFTDEALPTEVLDARAEFTRFLACRADSDHVAVRVDVGHQTRSKVPDLAVAISEWLLSLSVSIVNRGWVRTGSTIRVADGRIEGGTHDRISADMEGDQWRYRFQIDTREVRHLLAEKSDAVVITPDLKWMLDLLEAIRRGARRSPSGRLALAVQALERVDAITVMSGDWAQFSASHLRDDWVFEKSTDELVFAMSYATAHSAVNWLINESDSLIAHRRLRARFDGLMAGEFETQVLADVADEARPLLRRNTYVSDRLRWASRVTSPQKARTHLSQMADDFDLMLERIQRYRNAAVHGGPQSSEIVEWCADFAEELAARAISYMLSEHFWARIQEKQSAELPGCRLGVWPSSKRAGLLKEQAPCRWL